MRVQDTEARFGNVLFILDRDILEPRDFRTENFIRPVAYYNYVDDIESLLNIVHSLLCPLNIHIEL